MNIGGGYQIVRSFRREAARFFAVFVGGVSNSSRPKKRKPPTPPVGFIERSLMSHYYPFQYQGKGNWQFDCVCRDSILSTFFKITCTYSWAQNDRADAPMNHQLILWNRYFWYGHQKQLNLSNLSVFLGNKLILWSEKLFIQVCHPFCDYI